MKNRRTRSAIYAINQEKEIKVIPQKKTFEKGLEKIFSKEPSHLGYKGDIENLINDIGIKEEDFLYLTILSLSKIVRNNNDTRTISSYLYTMPNLIKFFKGNNDSNKTEQEILKDLINLSKSILYEKYDKNHILMRFGEIGLTAYVLLKGNADVLIKNFKIMSINKYDYLFYLANLIRYNEYGLLNDVINENFNIFPIEFDDDNEYNDNKHKPRIHTFQNIENNNNIQDNQNSLNKINTEQRFLKRNTQNKAKNIKLSEKNLGIILYKNPFKISEDKLLELFNLKRINIKNLHCSYHKYINRLKLNPNDYKFYINEQLMNEIIKKNERENQAYNKKKDTKKEDYNAIYYFKIFSYVKVVSLGKGTLFGELALTNDNSLRTSTVISSKECDIIVFNKKTFNNCLKKGAAVHIKKLLSFFVNLPIFNGISEYIFYHKYYSYLSKKIMTRGNYLINQGESPKGIILLQSGIYGISTRISLDSLTKFILYLINSNLKGNKNNNEKYKKYQKQFLNINKIINQTKSLLNENIQFKNFYEKEINIRITELSSPDIIGFKEYVNENGLYSFTIETHSNENIFYILDNKFYSEILHKNHTIRKNQLEFSEKKINVMINRLIILRNCFVNYYFENKKEKMNSIISKELDILNITKIRQKSAFKKRITEYNFINKTKELELKNKRTGRNDKTDIKSFSSYNQIEFTKDDSPKKNNSFSLNVKANFTIKNPQQLNKEKNKENFLYKTSNNYFKKGSGKRIIFDSKNKKININNKGDNSLTFNKTIKDDIYKVNNKEKKHKIYFFNRKYRIAINFPRLNSSVNSSRNIKNTGILLNNMVLEEINKKMNDKIILNDKGIIDKQSLNSLMTNSIKLKKEKKSTPYSDYNKLIFQYKHPYLRKSVSELSFKKIRVKSKLIINPKTNKYRDLKTNKAIKIFLNIKKMYSPLEINSCKSKENSILNKTKINSSKDKENFKLNNYSNLKSRMKIYYNNLRRTKK